MATTWPAFCCLPACLPPLRTMRRLHILPAPSYKLCLCLPHTRTTAMVWTETASAHMLNTSLLPGPAGCRRPTGGLSAFIAYGGHAGGYEDAGAPPHNS